MPRRLPTAELAQREYLTPGQCAQVYGRGWQFWARALDTAQVDGYRDGSRGDRYIRRTSAEAYLERIGTQVRYEQPERQTWRDAAAAFRARRKLAAQG